MEVIGCHGNMMACAVCAVMFSQESMCCWIVILHGCEKKMEGKNECRAC